MWIDGERSADREINAPTPFDFDFDRSVEYKKRCCSRLTVN